MKRHLVIVLLKYKLTSTNSREQATTNGTNSIIKMIIILLV